MQVEVLDNTDSSSSFNKSEDNSNSKPLWRAPETTGDVTFQSLHRGSLDRSSSVTASLKESTSKGKLSMSTNTISGAQAAQMISSETSNPLSIQPRPPLSASSSNLVKRIVENQNLLIWQAYDDWRQKFPRLQFDDKDEEIEENEAESEAETEPFTSDSAADES
ncbi:hypothetical protein PGT21_028103 [Puccinia graminis f. sp. tritici]|uniref:Uncharacterized protein n=1 Tax=Puccinia graminis f. sp. tritici TaxID=56615 RepID=A0A5B0MW45_PUCGR|nr:hypothetical protein PGT21_028103 [Puccinia graminis f. sp. tritici]KAA1131195.1 hypothetical protein PGTUg99_023167 [Puccinia graminis f. sp. tritici]